MLGWIAGILLIFWVLGFFFKLGAVVLNILLILAVVSFVMHFIFRGRGRKMSK